MPRHTNFLFHSIFLLLPIVLISCQDDIKPVTKEEALDFAKKLEISIGKRDGTFMDNAFDTKTVMKRANLSNNPNTASIQNNLKLGTSMLDNMTSEGNYVFIKEYEKNNTTHLLFRLYDNGKINYHDIELINRNGQCRIADIYIYILGENFSETLRNFYHEVEGDIDNSSKSDETMAWMKKIPEMRRLMTQGNYRGALELYDNVPDKYKSGKLLQILHIGICSGLTNEEYSKAIDEYRRYFPDEPNTALLLIDGYVLHKEYDKALASVNTLDSQINKDPFLDYYRYLCYNLLEQKDSSLACIERVANNEPDFGKATLELIANYLENHDYDKAAPFVEKYKSRREWEQSTLSILLDRYPDFNPAGSK